MRLGVNLLFLIPGEVGGTETYARRLLEALVETFPQDEYVLFCNRENAGTFAAGPGVTRVPCPVTARSRARRILYEQVALPSLARRQGVELLWSPGYTSPFRCPCPSVVTIHDLQFRHHPEDFSTMERLATRLLVKASCVRADHVLTVSRNAAEDIVRLNGVPADRVTAVHHGVAREFASPIDAERSRALLGAVGVSRPFLLAIANSYPHKNLAGLVRAYARIEEAVPHALVIVGQARRGEPALQEALGQLKHPARVLRLKGLPEETLRALYQAADLFVFPTLFEGFGLPVIEAMASGAPVACSDIPTLREVAGDAAEFFDPADARDMAQRVHALLQDDARRRALRASGLAHARAFTWTRAAQASRDAFARAADAGRRSRG